MKDFRIVNNKVWIGEFEEIWFENEIVGIMGSSNLLFVLTDPEVKEDGTNLYAINDQGEIQWRLQDPREKYDLDKLAARIFNFRIESNDYIVASGYFGHGFLVEISSGKVVGRQDTK